MGVLAISVAGCVGTSSAPAPSAPDSAPPGTPAATSSLRAAAEPTKRKVGVALATWFMSEAKYSEVAAREFDSLTAENEMKWYATEPSPGKFTFEAGDKLVRFAEQHQMRVRGHTLVWHNQLAPWVNGLTGNELKQAMLRHVRETTLRWKGRIAQWDVVNEAIDDSGKLRENSPFTALGPGYIADAFKAAHEADPKAQLFYNDYEIEAFDSPKTRGALRAREKPQRKRRAHPRHRLYRCTSTRGAGRAPKRCRKTSSASRRLGLRDRAHRNRRAARRESRADRERKLAKQSELAAGVVRACLGRPGLHRA